MSGKVEMWQEMSLEIGSKNWDQPTGILSGFLKLSDTESVNFRCVPNQVLYQAEPLPELGVQVRIIGRGLVRFPAWYAPSSVAESPA